ncbi:hypothetical protein CGRA01v4_14642 [Colletotrichum graminicola]|nr:hypothetical protein CGRA01v4_14642 [Colletotrichum graminicola]
MGLQVSSLRLLGCLDSDSLCIFAPKTKREPNTQRGCFTGNYGKDNTENLQRVGGLESMVEREGRSRCTQTWNQAIPANFDPKSPG